MSGAFRPVNSPLTTPTPDARNDGMPSPTPSQSRAGLKIEQPAPVDDATTPTRASFQAALSTQMPLPTSPFPQAVQVPNSEQRASSQVKSEDVEMEGSSPAGPGETELNAQDEAGSDEDSVNADGTRSGKKKKTQRFYCTGYAPCNLSFTRSEHLARHIRKHTGERPFQCHCSRRFSRLDNLRQHAQTVHINEDIPIDSLAATSSRYQRQIRTDRARTTGRARASTAGSIGVPVRGHSKSLSTSSITSIGSVGSAFSTRDDIRRRPAPLVMADHRASLSMESYQSNGDSSYSSYRHPSPGDFSTPTSATFSTNQSSPRWSAMASPTSAHSRSHSMFSDNRAMARRLSVPSGPNPYQPVHGGVPGHPAMVSGMPGPGPGGLSPHGGHFITPPPSGWSSRRDSISTTASEEAWRRRTWHPDSRNFAAPSSNLDSVATSDTIHLNPPAPLANAPPNRNSNIRLPGIESFDTGPRPATPPRRAPSPMAVDSSPSHSQPLSADIDDRRNTSQWDMGLHRGLTRLDISKNPSPPRDSAGAWANETDRTMQARADQARANPPTVRFQVEPPPSYAAEARRPPRSYHQHTLSAPSITTPRETKRHGWYHGPVGPTVPEHPAQGDPSADQNLRPHKIDRMVHPNIAAFPGFPARDTAPQQPSPQQSNQGNPESLRRLEALVAVATSEGKTAAAY